MANYDFVLPYEAEFEMWLSERDYPHPVAKPGSRFPTKQEVLDAILNTGTLRVECADEGRFFAVNKESKPESEYEVRIGCCDWDALGKSDKVAITMHGGSITLELMLLEALSHKCGQIVLYPDTGAPAVIVQPGMNTEETAKLWDDSHKESDPWKYFFEKAGY